MENENERQYIWRLASAKESGVLDLSWEELTSILNKELKDEDCEFTSAAYRKPYQYARQYYEDVFSKMKDDEYSQEILKNKYELQKERVKLSTDKLEINRWIRESAREEMFWEKLIEEVRASDTNPKPIKKIDIIHNKRAGILDFADQHFGKEYKIYGLRNEVINEYSPEIFYQRMEVLYNEILNIIKK